MSPEGIDGAASWELCVRFNPIVDGTPHTTYYKPDRCGGPYNDGSGGYAELCQSEGLEHQRRTGQWDKGERG